GDRRRRYVTDRAELIDVVARSDLEHRTEDTKTCRPHEMLGLRIECDRASLCLLDQLVNDQLTRRRPLLRIAGRVRSKDHARVDLLPLGELAVPKADLTLEQLVERLADLRITARERMAELSDQRVR